MVYLLIYECENDENEITTSPHSLLPAVYKAIYS